jgi:hypothetical protein
MSDGIARDGAIAAWSGIREQGTLTRLPECGTRVAATPDEDGVSHPTQNRSDRSVVLRLVRLRGADRRRREPDLRLRLPRLAGEHSRDLGADVGGQVAATAVVGGGGRCGAERLNGGADATGHIDEHVGVLDRIARALPRGDKRRSRAAVSSSSRSNISLIVAIAC